MISGPGHPTKCLTLIEPLPVANIGNLCYTGYRGLGPCGYGTEIAEDNLKYQCHSLLFDKTAQFLRKEHLHVHVCWRVGFLEPKK